MFLFDNAIFHILRINRILVGGVVEIWELFVVRWRGIYILAATIEPDIIIIVGIIQVVEPKNK